MLPGVPRQRKPYVTVPERGVRVNEYDNKLCAVYGYRPKLDDKNFRVWVSLAFVVLEAAVFLALCLVHIFAVSRDLYSWALIGFQMIHIITLSTAPAYFLAIYNPLLTTNLVIFRGAALIIDLIVVLARLIVRPPAETEAKWIVMLVLICALAAIDIVLLFSMGYGARWVSEFHRLRGRAISEMSAKAESARKFNAPTRGVYFARSMLTTLSKLSFDVWSFHLVFFALYLFMFPSLSTLFLLLAFGSGLVLWPNLWAYIQLTVGTINNSDPFQSDMGMIYFPESVQIDKPDTKAVVQATGILCIASAAAGVGWIVGQFILIHFEAPNIFVRVIYTVICILGILLSCVQTAITGAMAYFVYRLHCNLKSMLEAKQDRITKAFGKQP